MTLVDAAQHWLHSVGLYLRWGGGLVAGSWLACAAPRFFVEVLYVLRPAPSRPAPDPHSASARWQAIQRDHDRIKDEYRRLRIDPFRADELAVLADLTVPEAVALVQGLAAASDAADTANPPTYEKAVLHLAHSWRQAQARAADSELQAPSDRSSEPRVCTPEPAVQPAQRRPCPPIPKEQKCR
ncbi:hypothetical protein [Streptomyces erythrochromogenes]|uniref:hypothetical protein n=1 Tax=Streptomyces erythrochromogenes TaxID=285574 RepID=UPI003447D1F4